MSILLGHVYQHLKNLQKHRGSLSLTPNPSTQVVSEWSEAANLTGRRAKQRMQRMQPRLPPERLKSAPDLRRV